MTRLTRAAMFAALTVGLSTTMVLAEEPAAAAPAPAHATPAPGEKAANPTAMTAATGELYSPPPGFKTKARKGQTVYCRSRAPLGTRIKSEECFTEAEIKEVERAMAISADDIKQRGRMCTSGTMCTGEGGG